MAIPLQDYDRIFSRPGRLKGPGDEGFALSEEDEQILDRVWADRAKREGVKSRPSMTPEQIREHYENSK